MNDEGMSDGDGVVRGKGIKGGDGSALRPVTGLQPLWRGQFGAEHGGHRYAVDVDYLDWNESAVLYRDGVQVARGGNPASFELGDGARIETRMSLYGMSRAHLVTADGERQLTPAPGTGEAWRADLEREHPGVSRLLGLASLTVLVVALVLELPQLLEVFTHTGLWDQVSNWRFDSPIELSPGVNTALTLAGVAAGLERALRLRHNPLLDD